MCKHLAFLEIVLILLNQKAHIFDFLKVFQPRKLKSQRFSLYCFTANVIQSCNFISDFLSQPREISSSFINQCLSNLYEGVEDPYFKIREQVFLGFGNISNLIKYSIIKISVILPETY